MWFWAAYLMTRDKRGVSALLLQRPLDVSYKTAWLLLHKLRRAMVAPEREKLRGVVEMDETWVGRLQTGLRGSRQLKGRKAALVIVAVERRGTATGRARMDCLIGLTSLLFRREAPGRADRRARAMPQRRASRASS
jgi:hypothetical protein